MTTFLESPRFPEEVSWGSQGGPMWRTTVVSLWSGNEQRNIDWQYPLHKYNAKFGIRDEEDLYNVLEFFWVTGGRAIGFRFKDFNDYKSCTGHPRQGIISSTDQLIGTGDGANLSFQLVKYYTAALSARTRLIKKPVSDTVVVSVNDVTVPPADYTVDYATGIITFDAGKAPGNGLDVKAGFEFDTPCRFESDGLNISAEFFDTASTDISIVEVRL